MDQILAQLRAYTVNINSSSNNKKNSRMKKHNKKKHNNSTNSNNGRMTKLVLQEMMQRPDMIPLFLAIQNLLESCQPPPRTPSKGFRFVSSNSSNNGTCSNCNGLSHITEIVLLEPHVHSADYRRWSYKKQQFLKRFVQQDTKQLGIAIKVQGTLILDALPQGAGCSDCNHMHTTTSSHHHVQHHHHSTSTISSSSLGCDLATTVTATTNGAMEMDDYSSTYYAENNDDSEYSGCTTTTTTTLKTMEECHENELLYKNKRTVATYLKLLSQLSSDPDITSLLISLQDEEPPTTCSTATTTRRSSSSSSRLLSCSDEEDELGCSSLSLDFGGGSNHTASSSGQDFGRRRQLQRRRPSKLDLMQSPVQQVFQALVELFNADTRSWTFVQCHVDYRPTTMIDTTTTAGSTSTGMGVDREALLWDQTQSLLEVAELYEIPLQVEWHPILVPSSYHNSSSSSLSLTSHHYTTPSITTRSTSFVPAHLRPSIEADDSVLAMPRESSCCSKSPLPPNDSSMTRTHHHHNTTSGNNHHTTFTQKHHHHQGQSTTRKNIRDYDMEDATCTTLDLDASGSTALLGHF